MNFQLKPISIATIPLVCLLHKVCFTETYTNILPAPFLENMTMEKLNNYWQNMLSNSLESQIIFYKNLPIGFYSIGNSRQAKYDGTELYNLYLLKEFQGKSIGSKIMDNLLQQYKELLVIVVKKNLNAQQFYQRKQMQLIEIIERKYAEQWIEECVYYKPFYATLI